MQETNESIGPLTEVWNPAGYLSKMLRAVADSGKSAAAYGKMGLDITEDSSMHTVDTVTHIFFRHRFGILFVLLICVLLIPPYFQAAAWIDTLWSSLFTCVLLWALYSIAGTQRVMLLAALVLIPTLASTWLIEDSQQKSLAYIDNITNIIYFGLICFYLSKYILTSNRATLEVIFAAMCLYIMLAVLWAAIYTNLELYYVGAFSFNGQFSTEAGIDSTKLFRQMIYFSFVTISTLGYGDVLPLHRVAQNWAAVETMIGQFYIAIILARLVSLHTVEGGRRNLETQEEC